jgi:hypothetical protein
MKSIVVAALMVAAATTAAAQNEMPRGFVGGGATIGSEAPGTRMRLGDDGGSEIWLLQAAVRVAPRAWLGVEVIQPGVSEGETRGRTFQSSGRQEERALLATGRLRVASGTRVSLDAIAGGGILFQRHEREDTPCVLGCGVPRTESMANRATAFALGADVPIRVTRHLSVVPLGRVYVFQRGEHVSGGPTEPSIPWQFEWLSSRRFGVGAAARATW